MGIEVIIIAVIILVGVVGYWAWQRQQNEPTGNIRPITTERQEPTQEETERVGSIANPDEDEHNDSVDENIRQRGQAEPEPLNPKIDDTQIMKAVTPPAPPVPPQQSALPSAPPPAPPKPVLDETSEWMDKLAKEKADSGDEMIQFGDVDDYAELLPLEEEIEEEPTLDIDYPEKKVQPEAPATTAHFSAFYPREAEVNQRYSAVIYAHAEAMLEQIKQDAERFKEEIGGTVPPPRTTKQSKSLQHGSKITVLLESEELDFEPELLTKTWHGDWTRFNFEFRPSNEFVDETAFVRASIMVLGFEIAKIKFAIEIVERKAQAQVMPMIMDEPTNPFAQAKMQSTTTSGYDKIFISYSRKDKFIAEAFKVIQEAAGNDVFFDVDDIRTGADWKAAIAEAIDNADYMQVFWSENSASSEWCGYEWDYALNYRCKETNCREFIRPVWWNAPMPTPPDNLGHLNFKRMDLKALMKLGDI